MKTRRTSRIYTIVLFCGTVVAYFLAPLPVRALNIIARISDQSTEVSGGDRLYFEVDIKYPENPRRKDLRIEYQIHENGEVIATEKVLRAVETQASFLDYIVVPKSTRGGAHELVVIVGDYDNLHAEVSASFKVLKGLDRATTYFYIILGSVFLVGILVVLQIRSIRKRV